MGALPILARQLITIGALATAIAAPIGLSVAATPAGSPAYLAQCKGGEEPDNFTTTCVPFVTPNTSGTSATAISAAKCPAGVSGTECGPQGGGTAATNPQPSEAERAAAGNEQVGQDVAESAGGLGAM